MSAALPFISVIVPAYNRPDALKALLDSLEDQSYPSYRFEVLVSDDGSVPPLAEQVSVKGYPYSVRFLRGPNAGPATARNRALQDARGTLIAFTDDDCVPAPTWLEAIAGAMEDPATYAVHGPIQSSIPPIDPFVHSIHIDQRHGVATANFAVRKDHLVAVEGFDETFTAPYFEDEDLARRLRMRFGEIDWAEGVKVEHPPRTVPFGRAWRAAGYFYFLPLMQRRYEGYWPEAMRGVRRRALAKAALVLIGCLPFLGLPTALFFAWGAILAWQAKRLQRVLALALAHGVRIPIRDQLAFVFTEWLLDFVRWRAYARGRTLEPKPRDYNLEELLR